MSESRVIRRDAILKIKKTMRELRQKNKTLGEEVDKIIKKETFEEKVQLERAMERYNNKMNKVLKSKEVADRLDKQEDCQEKMSDLVSKVEVHLKKLFVKL